MTKNIKIMLILFIVTLLYLFVFGCDDVSVDTNGKMEDWNVTGVDTAVEDAAEPILDFGDDVVEALRDAGTEVIDWSVSQ